jgi:hypothetical protein
MSKDWRAWRAAAARRVLSIAILAGWLAAPAAASTCQYQARPTSVVRSNPGFGVVFGTFRLIDASNGTCPDNIQAIQFSGAIGAHKAIFVATIETCLNAATMLVVNEGQITFMIDDPVSPRAGVVVGDYRGVPVSECRQPRWCFQSALQSGRGPRRRPRQSHVFKRRATCQGTKS